MHSETCCRLKSLFLMKSWNMKTEGRTQNIVHTVLLSDFLKSCRLDVLYIPSVPLWSCSQWTHHTFHTLTHTLQVSFSFLLFSGSGRNMLSPEDLQKPLWHINIIAVFLSPHSPSSPLSHSSGRFNSASCAALKNSSSPTCSCCDSYLHDSSGSSPALLSKLLSQHDPPTWTPVLIT